MSSWKGLLLKAGPNYADGAHLVVQMKVTLAAARRIQAILLQRNIRFFPDGSVALKERSLIKLTTRH
jgi:hypothetical protein